MSADRELPRDVEASIREGSGTAFRIDAASARTLDAPSATATNTTISGAGQRFFVKLAPRHQADRFAAEADGLDALRKADTFRIPELVARGENTDHAWLVLEWLDLRPIRDATTATRAAEALAALHSIEGEHFGWHRDNYIGATPQINTPRDNWARFFALQRLRPQFELAISKGYTELKPHAERLVERLPALFVDHQPRSSLLHGDLWHGNIAALPDGRPALYDPACYFGDGEADLAMSELFGGLPSAFYAGYRGAIAVSADFESRKLVYTLYHLLNHLNLLGSGYLSQTLRTARQALAAISA